MPHTLEAVLHDSTAIPLSVQGAGRSVRLPVRIEPYPPSEAETMRRWGADPELGPNLVAGLSRTHRVISADYEGHRMAHPAPDTLTPANLAADLLAIADAAGADTFAYYGYSWLALAGTVAVAPERLWGWPWAAFPPLDGPTKSRPPFHGRRTGWPPKRPPTASRPTSKLVSPGLTSARLNRATGTPFRSRRQRRRPGNSSRYTRRFKASTTPR